jgi:RNA polymerase sigma factor (sigma-70 family)
MPSLTSSGVGSTLPRLALHGLPDSRLVELVRNGREDAFEEIHNRYRRRLTDYAASIVPAHRADDVVQETFVKANTAMTTGEAEISLRPWLYRIARNTALNDLRDEPPPHEELDLEYDGVPQPPDIVARREEIRELTRSIKGLPEQQREALVQRELEGRSHDEIATSLGVSAGAVRQLIFRARRGLRESVAAFLPLPLKTALTIFAVSGTVATGVAVKESVVHHGRPSHPHAATATPGGSSAVATSTSPARTGRERHESSRSRAGDGAPVSREAAVTAAPQPSVALPITAAPAPDAVNELRHAIGPADTGQSDPGSSSGPSHPVKKEKAKDSQSSSSAGGGGDSSNQPSGQANGHDGGHGSGKAKDAGK